MLKKIFLCGFFLYLYLSIGAFQIVGKIKSLRFSLHELNREMASGVPDSFLVKLIFTALLFLFISLLAIVAVKCLKNLTAWSRRIILFLVFGNIVLTVWADYIFRILGGFPVSKLISGLVVGTGFLFACPGLDTTFLLLQVIVAIGTVIFLSRDSNKIKGQ